jgi:hypothetical protein
VLAQDSAHTDGLDLGARLGDFSTGIEDIEDLDADDVDFDSDDNAAVWLTAARRF